MQAAPVRVTTVRTIQSAVPAIPARPTIPTISAIPAMPSFGTALRVVESLLMSGGQATARRNAWTAVLEDRRRARDRREVEHALEAVATRGTSAT